MSRRIARRFGAKRGTNNKVWVRKVVVLVTNVPENLVTDAGDTLIGFLLY